MDGYPAGGWGDSNEPESRSSFRAVPVLAHQTELSWPSFNSSWSSRCGVGRSGLAALLRVPRRPAHGSAGTWKICRLACHCELFHKTGIARGRDEQRCFRRVQNYFGVLREKELFERPFFFSPQASPAEHLQVNEVVQYRDSLFVLVSGEMWNCSGRKKLLEKGTVKSESSKKFASAQGQILKFKSSKFKFN